MSKKIWLKGLMAMAIAGALFVPVMAHADGLNITLNADMGADDEAHFHFGGDHHRWDPALYNAAKDLQAAKHKLWESRRRNDPDGAKLKAIDHINQALDQLRFIVEVDHHNR